MTIYQPVRFDFGDASIDVGVFAAWTLSGLKSQFAGPTGTIHLDPEGRLLDFLCRWYEGELEVHRHDPNAELQFETPDDFRVALKCHLGQTISLVTRHCVAA